MRLSFGRYIPKNSVIHKMDPRYKIAMIILLIIAIFFKTGYTGYIILTAVILLIYGLSKLSWKMLARVFIPTSIIFLVILIINIFLMKMDTKAGSDALTALAGLTGHGASNGAELGYLTKNGFQNINNLIPDNAWVEVSGKTARGYLPWIMNEKLEIIYSAGVTNPASPYIALGHFYKWHAVWFSERALYSSFIMGWRIFLMITLTTIITGTTQPMEITLGLEDLLSPLKWIGIPVHILSTIISIALRMIPDLIDEAGRIMKAQASRGIDMKNGNPKDKIRGLVSLIIPLLVSSFQKAEDLAYAMDARDYDPHAKRTRFHQFDFNWMDLMFLLVFGGIAVFMMVYGGMGAQWMFMHIQYLDGITVY